MLALLFATNVTRVLVRSVRDLVTGAEAIEAGNLDAEVPVTTYDEVARRMSLIALAAPVCLVCDFCLIFIPLRVIAMNQKYSLMQYR